MADEVPFYRKVKLEQVQRELGLLRSIGLMSLAWLTHEVEMLDPPDDVTFLAIQDEVLHREKVLPGAARIYHDAYMRLWKEHHDSSIPGK